MSNGAGWIQQLVSRPLDRLADAINRLADAGFSIAAVIRQTLPRSEQERLDDYRRARNLEDFEAGRP